MFHQSCGQPWTYILSFEPSNDMPFLGVKKSMNPSHNVGEKNNGFFPCSLDCFQFTAITWRCIHFCRTFSNYNYYVSESSCGISKWLLIWEQISLLPGTMTRLCRIHAAIQRCGHQQGGIAPYPFVDSHHDSWRFLATSDTSTRIEITHTSGRPAEKATRPRCDQSNALIDEGAKVGTKG